MSLFFRIESLCTECGKFIREVAQGPYFNHNCQFVMSNNRLSDDTPLSDYDFEICDECKQKIIDESFPCRKDAKELIARCRRKGCEYEGSVDTFKPAMSPYHDMRCPKCGTTNVDTSALKAALGDDYGYGDRNSLERS
jgi:hypothetical protein